MVTTIIWVAYGVGYLWFWRYFVGWFFEDFGIDEGDDLIDVFMCFFIGSIVSIAYPVVVPCRMAARLYYRTMSNKQYDFKKFFPAPKPVDDHDY